MSYVQTLIACVIGLFLCLGLEFTSLWAQPSGGPYGPVAQTYEMPKIKGKIYYVAPDGKIDNSGQSIEQPASIEAAFSKVSTGDAIVLRGGTYRTGNLILNQGITIQPYKDERPVLKGTLEAKEWRNLRNGLWITHWEHLFPMKPQGWWQRQREGKRTPLHLFNNDMVFVDGRLLQSKGWEGEVDENSFYIDYESGTVYIGTDPTDRTIEVTAFDVAIHRITDDVHGKKSDGKGPTIRGITFTQYAYRAFEFDGKNPEGVSDEANHGKDVVGTTLEHCAITYCSRVGGYFRGDSLTIRNCKVSDTSTEGIFVLSSSDVLLERNILTRNNIEDIYGYYPAAVKIFNQCYRVTCNDNLVTELPNSHGIWYDVGNVDGVFTNNWVEGVGNNNEGFRKNSLWPAYNGFFFEISKGVTCAGNVFVDSDYGLMILNSSNAHIYQNTFLNSTLAIGRTGRSAQGDHFGWHPATGPDVNERHGHVVRNNLFTGDGGFEKPLVFVWQPVDLCERVSDSPMKALDHNVYVRAVEKAEHPLIYWSPAKNADCQLEFDSLAGLQAMNFAAHSRFFSGYSGPLFQSPELKRLQLLNSFPGATVAMEVPEEIQALLGGIESKYVGAYAAQAFGIETPVASKETLTRK